MACETTSPTNSCSLLSSNKDFTHSLLAFEGSFSSTRPLDELPNIIPSTGDLQLDLSAALDTASPPPIFEASTHIIPTPPRQTCSSLSPSSLSHYSPASSNASEYIKCYSVEPTSISSPEGSSCHDDLFILSTCSNSNQSLSLCSPARGSITEHLQEGHSTVLQLGELEEQNDGDINIQSVFVAETEEAQPLQKQEDTTTMHTSSGELKEARPSSPIKAKQDTLPRNIKLPQRKGGMQLWQFLYALLGNSASSKYGKLIEWTANRNSREFRLLEPEAIAIWWGEHKSKKNMSYDKLSRSLRYYYDKGIIRKIPGERYVYQFCIDPEVMYKHIGNSDCRPKLKPMPMNARRATTDYQLRHGYNPSMLHHKDSIFLPPGHLMIPPNGIPGSYSLSGSEMPYPPPEYSSLSTYSPSYYDAAYAPLGMDMYATAPITPPAGLEYTTDDIKPHLPLRSHHYLYAQESDGYAPSLMHSGVFLPNMMGPPPLQSITPPHPPSEGNSPQMSSYPQHPQLLDELIEPAGNCEQLSHPPIIYSPCSDGPYVSGTEMETASQWTFN